MLISQHRNAVAAHMLHAHAQAASAASAYSCIGCQVDRWEDAQPNSNAPVRGCWAVSVGIFVGKAPHVKVDQAEPCARAHADNPSYPVPVELLNLGEANDVAEGV